MGSDGVILSPYVEVIKDASSETLTEPFSIGVTGSFHVLKEIILQHGIGFFNTGLPFLRKMEFTILIFRRRQQSREPWPELSLTVPLRPFLDGSQPAQCSDCASAEGMGNQNSYQVCRNREPRQWFLHYRAYLAFTTFPSVNAKMGLSQ